MTMEVKAQVKKGPTTLAEHIVDSLKNDLNAWSTEGDNRIQHRNGTVIYHASNIVGKYYYASLINEPKVSFKAQEQKEICEAIAEFLVKYMDKQKRLAHNRALSKFTRKANRV